MYISFYRQLIPPAETPVIEHGKLADWCVPLYHMVTLPEIEASPIGWAWDERGHCVEPGVWEFDDALLPPDCMQVNPVQFRAMFDRAHAWTHKREETDVDWVLRRILADMVRPSYVGVMWHTYADDLSDAMAFAQEEFFERIEGHRDFGAPKVRAWKEMWLGFSKELERVAREKTYARFSIERPWFYQP